MNWLIIIVVGIFAVALIIFFVIRNQKDKRQFIDELNNDYPRRDAEEGDIEIDELTDGVH